MPEGLDLPATYSVRWSALDPVTGDDVAGVLIEAGSLLVTQLTAGGADALASTPPVGPQWIPIPLDVINNPDSS